MTASAPGKIILMGEHSVVYGHPALVAALNLRARARVRPAPGLAPTEVELRLRDIDRRELLERADLVAYAESVSERWRRHRQAEEAGDFAEVRGGDPAHVVKVALGEAIGIRGGGAAPRPPGRERAKSGVRLLVESELPVGAGFGSSAAVGAAVVRAWLAWDRVSLAPDAMERLLLDVERRQHESPSGVDGAAILRGGTVWAEPRSEGDGLEARPGEVSPSHLERFHVVDTGTPAHETGAVVSAVRERRSRHPDRIDAVLRRMGETTRRFRRVLADPDGSPEQVVRLVRRFERGLEELGVVPPPARRLVRAVEARGGAAKISGAGALESPSDGPPAAGALLVYHPEPRAPTGWEELEGLPFYGVELGAEGQRLDAGS